MPPKNSLKKDVKNTGKPWILKIMEVYEPCVMQKLANYTIYIFYIEYTLLSQYTIILTVYKVRVSQERVPLYNVHLGWTYLDCKYMFKNVLYKLIILQNNVFRVFRLLIRYDLFYLE